MLDSDKAWNNVHFLSWAKFPNRGEISWMQETAANSPSAGSILLRGWLTRFWLSRTIHQFLLFQSRKKVLIINLMYQIMNQLSYSQFAKIFSRLITKPIPHSGCLWHSAWVSHNFWERNMHCRSLLVLPWPKWSRECTMLLFWRPLNRALMVSREEARGESNLFPHCLSAAFPRRYYSCFDFYSDTICPLVIAYVNC